jgi:hypothetical protein
LFEKISTSRSKIYEVEIEKSADQEKDCQSGKLKKFNDIIITFIFTDDSGIGLVYLSRDKSKCPHTL